jgi:hypothetical protein
MTEKRITSYIEKTAAEKQKQLHTLRPMDANVWLGKPKEFPLAPELFPADVEKEARRYGYAGCLVSHWKGVTLSAQDGNRALLEAERFFSGDVYTVWTGLPLLPREQEPLPGFGPPQGRMRGVRLFPKSHRYPFTPWVVGDLCAWCIEFRVPLFVWHVENDWRDLFATAAEFPELTIVVETQWQKILYHNRVLYNLLDRCQNVLVEISNFAGQDFLQHGVQQFGAERFLFGSFLPVSDPYVPLGMVVDSGLTEKEQERIARGNLERLVQGVKT